MCGRTRQWVRRFGLATALVALSGALGVTGCLQQTCSEAGCTSGLSVKVVGQPAGDPARVRACLDGTCAVVPWPARGASCEAVQADWQQSVCLQDDGTFITLAFASDASVRDGMKFELFIEDPAGEALLHESEKVAFSDSYPNGKRCPGHCKYANYRY
ncbi:MAG TPA: hypothetical protein VFU02_14295 [Polyangiaceae bacterium]|nr:hypothetical protein [Polyangiaceae bacterium]